MERIVAQVDRFRSVRASEEETAVIRKPRRKTRFAQIVKLINEQEHNPMATISKTKPTAKEVVSRLQTRPT